MYPYIILVLCPPKQLHLSDFDFIPFLLTETFLKILAIRGTPDSTTTTTRITTAAQGTTKTPETADLCRPVPETFPFNRQLLPCSWRSDSVPCRHRTRAVLRCSNLSTSIVEERVKVGTPPVAVTFSDPCLMRVVRERCSQTGRPVPRVVHYVQFSPSGKWMSGLTGWWLESETK